MSGSGDLEFTHEAYRAFLGELGRGRRPVVAFRDIPAGGPFAILRHDIDFSLAKAEEMAVIDAQEGVSATFFVMLSSPYYSALTQSGMATLRRILDLGHEIGLHFDPGDYRGMTREQIHGVLRTETNLLATRLRTEVTAVAQHKPAAGWYRLAPPELVDAYAEPYFDEIGYISDSRGAFREPDPLGFPRNHRRLQALIHPEWWSAEGVPRGEAMERVLAEIRGRAHEALDDELANLGIRAAEEVG